MADIAPCHLAEARPNWADLPFSPEVLETEAVLVKASPSTVSELSAIIPLPQVGELSVLGPVECCGLGPAEWLLLTGPEHAADLVDLQLTLDRIAAAAIVSDQYLVLELNLNFDEVASLTGLAAAAIARTRIARTRICDLPVMVLPGSGQRCRFIFDRTQAAHLGAWLRVAT